MKGCNSALVFLTVTTATLAASVDQEQRSFLKKSDTDHRSLLIPVIPAEAISLAGEKIQINSLMAACCPVGYMGFVPIDGCAGFVYCNEAEPVSRPTLCRPDQTFDTVMGACIFKELAVSGCPSATCTPPENSNASPSIESCCPAGETTVVPFDDCNGFISCSPGGVEGPVICQENLKYDVGAGACVDPASFTCSNSCSPA